ncbi:PAS domain S-box protein [Halorientalis marina]|uniref:PAS domain S-box protein n=1 Tax=Halorientalis marina TaxID=2931976 RepID=UPI001FF50317|nr:PAS domain S-box protein [Halorientalis marina]
MSRQFSVLYVGSDSDVPTHLQDGIGSDTVRVVEARATAEALSQLSEASFDCVVSDADPPEGDGFALHQSVRERVPRLPFVFLVGDGDADRVPDLLDDDATEYVLVDAEPAPYATVASRVRNVVGHGRTGGGGSDELSAALLAETTGAICVVAESLRIEYANPSAERLLGCGTSALVGEDVTAFVHPDDADSAESLFDAVLANPERTVTGEFRVLATDDEPRWVECRCRNQLSNPSIGGVVLTLTDVTDRKRKARDLRRFRQAVEQAGHAVYITDTDGTIEYVNPAFEEATGYSRTDAVGSNPRILKSGEHRPEFYASLWNKILAGNVWKGEVINERADGQRYVAEQTVAPIEDGTGEIDRFVAINTDITQRKAYERQLERYETIVENLPIGVFRTTPDDGGEFVEVNSGLVSIYDAYSKSELLRRDVREFYVDGDDREEFSRRLRENGRVTDFEVEHETLSGERIDVSLTAILTEDDGDVYFDGVLKDVTDRRQREQELERKNEQLEQFASIVTHDLRNPLNAAQSRLELARDGDCDHLAVVDEQLVRMEELIEDVLAIARHGQEVEETEPVDIGRLAESCWATVETGNAEVIVDTDQTLSVDTGRLRQLFENLFRNAVEHGSTGSQNAERSGDAIEHGGNDVTVRIGTLTDGFYVEDDGPGIPAEDRDQVFDHGFTTDEDGTGFGLNIVAEIVTAHGWEISVTEGTEGGARFEITGTDATRE